MTKLQVFGIIAGIASILSLMLSLFIVKQVWSIKTTITLKDNSQRKTRQSAKGDGNIQIGGDSDVG